jgi:hypothetical protein
MQEYTFRTNAQRIVAFVALALVVTVCGYESPPSEPAIFNTEHWIPLKHTDQPTFTAPASSVKPLPPVSESWKDPAAQIFVGVAHYRDKRCSTTLVNLFEKAQYPDRVHVGEYCRCVMFSRMALRVRKSPAAKSFLSHHILSDNLALTFPFPP